MAFFNVDITSVWCDTSDKDFGLYRSTHGIAGDGLVGSMFIMFMLYGTLCDERYL